MDWHLFFLPLIGGLGIAVVSGPLGCMMAWKRLAFLSDTLSHAALLGITLSVILSLNFWAGLLFLGFLFALGLAFGYDRKELSDSVLVLLSQASLCLSFILMSFSSLSSSHFMGYLVGDILTLNFEDVLLIGLGALGILGFVTYAWKALLAVTAHEDIAAIEGHPLFLLRFLFIAMLAIFLSLALKSMGALLVSSLMIAPPLTVRPFVQSPEGMSISSSFLSIVYVTTGLGFSILADIPTGACISGCALGGYFLSQMLVLFMKKNPSLR